MYLDYREAFEPYTYEERGRLITAMLDFAADGTLPELPGNERYLWSQLKGQIQRDQKKYRDRCEQNRRNALKRSALLPEPSDRLPL